MNSASWLQEERAKIEKASVPRDEALELIEQTISHNASRATPLYGNLLYPGANAAALDLVPSGYVAAALCSFFPDLIRSKLVTEIDRQLEGSRRELAHLGLNDKNLGPGGLDERRVCQGVTRGTIHDGAGGDLDRRRLALRRDAVAAAGPDVGDSETAEVTRSERNRRAGNFPWTPATMLWAKATPSGKSSSGGVPHGSSPMRPLRRYSYPPYCTGRPGASPPTFRRRAAR